MPSFLNARFAKNKLIYTFGTMILFFMLFDGIMSYLLPLVISEHGFSKTIVGIILATSAIAGAFFDFAIYKIFKKVFYRRLFTIMFLVSFTYIFTIWSANAIVLYLAAMAMWGFYYDLKNFGTLDFMSRHSPKRELSSNFGILQVFQSIGYLLAPLIAGFVITDIVRWQPFVLATVFLSVSLFFFIILLIEARRKKQNTFKEHSGKKFSEEFALWEKVGKAILPVLFLAIIATMFDSFFFTIGPLLAETLPIEPFDGIFMFAYFLPPLIMGGLVGKITKKIGEKKTALTGLLVGAGILSTMMLFKNAFVLVLVVFFASCFTCLMMPVIQSIYAKCIRETPKHKKEVQELGDFFGNIGYIIGPLAAGVLADKLGNTAAFSALGIIGIGFAVILFVVMPKKVRVSTK